MIGYVGNETGGGCMRQMKENMEEEKKRGEDQPSQAHRVRV